MTRVCPFCVMLFAVMALLNCSPSSAFEITEQGKSQIEADWLFQIEGNPTREAVQNEIKYTRALVARISALPGAPD